MYSYVVLMLVGFVFFLPFDFRCSGGGWDVVGGPFMGEPAEEDRPGCGLDGIGDADTERGEEEEDSFTG